MYAFEIVLFRHKCVKAATNSLDAYVIDWSLTTWF